MSADLGPSRRRVLTAAGAAVLAGALGSCTSEPTPPPPIDPDDALRDAAVEREQSLLQAYDAVLLAVPELTARLLPLRDQHLEHLSAVRPPVATPLPSASASPPVASVPEVPAVPPAPTTAEALAGLAAAERTAASAHALAALRAADRPLAGLLASLSASEASHPVALS
jgi:hypothetical protein